MTQRVCSELAIRVQKRQPRKIRKHPKTPCGRRKTPTSLLRKWSNVKI
jgi:hypothetical protein